MKTNIMKKTIILFAILIICNFSFNTSNGISQWTHPISPDNIQGYSLNEGFEGATLPGDWRFENFVQYPNLPYYGSKCIEGTITFGTCSIITPKVLLQNNDTLSFYYAGMQNNFSHKVNITVQIATTDSNTFTTIYYSSHSDIYFGNQYLQKKVPLSNYSGQLAWVKIIIDHPAPGSSWLLCVDEVFIGTRAPFYNNKPTLNSPSNGQTNVVLAPSLTWSGLSNATSYHIEVSPNITNDTNCLTTNYNIQDGLLHNNTSYSWRVRAKNENFISSYTSYFWFTTKALMLNSPLNNSTGQPLSITFKWYRAAPNYLFNYLFELSTDPSFTNIFIRDSLLTDTIKSVSGLNNNTQYWWRFKARNLSGWGNYSEAWNFKTIFTYPALVYPQNLAQNVNLSPTLDWDDVPGVSSYQIQIAYDSLFNSIVYSNNSLANSYHSISLGVLFLNTNYFWRVRGVNGSIIGEYSEIFRFTTLTNSQSTWFWQNPMPQGNIIKGLFFISQSTGWTVGEGGMIFKTINGGTNWTSQSLNIPYTLNSAFFINSNTGWAVGQNGALLMTINSGYNWATQNLNTTNTFNQIKFIDNNTGWIVGNSSSIYKTTNSGSTWEQKTCGTAFNITSFSFTDVNIGWACGNGGYIIRTLDGGSTWELQTSNYGIQFNSISFPDVYNGWAVGTSGKIMRTTNGSVWNTQTSGTTQQIIGVQFLNTTTGYFVGDNGIVSKTTNAGLNWVSQTSGTSNNLNSLFFTDVNTGYFGGISTLSKTINGGTNWNSLVQGTNQVLNSVFFANGNTGWTVGNNGTITYTTNSGSQWNAQTSGTTLGLNAVYYINSNTGWIVGNTGKILKSTNSGVNYVSQTSGVLGNLYSIYFITDSIGWSSGNGMILKTNLSGTFWTSQYTNGSFPIYSLYFLNQNTGCACGGSGYIYKTTNSGVNWTNQITNASDVHNAVKFINQNLGWAVSNSGKIYRTTNGGTNWVTQISGVSNNLYSLNIIDTSTVWIVGAGGQILKTTNAGTNWNIESSPTTNDLKSVFFASSGTGWSVGTNGTIIKTNSTLPPAPIAITYPNGGESISSGTVCNITWTTSGVSDLLIDYTTNNGTSWNSIVASTPSSTGNYNWNIPIGMSSANCKVRLSSVADPLISVASNSVFRIYTLPNAVILNAPSNGTVGLMLPFNLKWNKSAYALSYNIVIATDSLFTNVVFNDSNYVDSIKTINSLNNLTFYYWKVRAKNNDGYGSFSSIWKFKTLGQANPVTLSQPVNNSVEQPVSINFKWYKATEQTLLKLIGDKTTKTADFNNKPEEKTTKNKLFVNKNSDDGPTTIIKYWFELSTDSLYSNIVYKDTTLTDTTKSVTSLLYNQNYYWRVRALNQIGWGTYSNSWKFSTMMIQPPNNTNGVTLTPVLGWGVISGATSYRVQVSTDSSFATMAFDTAGVTTTSITIPPGKLTGYTLYYWKVTPSTIASVKQFYPLWTFRTLQNLTLNLKVYIEGFWNGFTQISDTVMVYLASSTTPFAFADTAKVILSPTGTATAIFTKIPNGSYYLVINHRNHLETWSKIGQSFITNVAVNYDFTTAMTQAFGDNMKQAGSVWVLYGGDANRDGSVDAMDVPIFITQYGTQGYLAADFNGDEDVNAIDVAIFVSNFGLTKAMPIATVSPVLKTKEHDLTRILDSKKKTKETVNTQDKNVKKNKVKKNNN